MIGEKNAYVNVSKHEVGKHSADHCTQVQVVLYKIPATEKFIKSEVNQMCWPFVG